MTMKKKRHYRGVNIYLKPITRWGDGTRMAAEINFGDSRLHVPTSKSVDSVMYKARRLIDKQLDRKKDVIAEWFKMRLV